MSAIATETSTTVNQGEQIVRGTIALSGNYGGAASHGDVLDLSQLYPIAAQSNQVPKVVYIEEAPPAGTAPTGYLFDYAPGTTQANGQLVIMNNLTEYTQGSAYSAGLLAASLVFEAVFPTFI